MTSHPMAAEAPSSARLRALGTPLIADRMRALAVFAVLVGAGVVGVLGAHVSDRTYVTSLDAKIWLHVIEQYGGYRELARHVASIGGMTGVILISVAIAGVMLVRGHLRGVVLALGGPVLATSLTEFVLKPWINHAPYGANTFPSGHATGAFSMAFVATILVMGPASPVRSVAARWAIALGSIAVATLVAVSLVVAGYHFATDTIGGAAVALCIVTTFALAIDGVAGPYARRQNSHV